MSLLIDQCHFSQCPLLEFDVNIDSYMKTFKPVSGHMIEQPLQRHHLYSCARSLLVERFPDLIQECKVSVLLFVDSCVMVLVVLVLLAESCESVVSHRYVNFGKCR